MKTRMDCSTNESARNTGAMSNASVGTQSSYYDSKAKTYKSSKAKSHKSSGSSGSGNSGVALGLLAGAGVGVLAGILLAPEKGKVMRMQVANSANTLGGQVKKGVDACKSTVSSWTSGMGKGKKKGDNSDLGGTVYKSPYTDHNKWDEQEVDKMIDDASNMPG